VAEAVAVVAVGVVVVPAEEVSSTVPYVVPMLSYRLRVSTKPTSFCTAASLTTPR
jgi:hypothetical protein